MKKTILSTIILGAFGVYVFSQNNIPSINTIVGANSIPSSKKNTSGSTVVVGTSNTTNRGLIVGKKSTAASKKNTSGSIAEVAANTTTTTELTESNNFEYENDGDSDNTTTSSTNNVPTTLPSSTTSTPPAVVKTTPSTTTTPVTTKKTGLYTDGSYVGPSVDAYYGNVQVKAVISGGKLINVIFLDYAKDRSNSIKINTRAMPLLTQEAIQAQSANVNGVSGASFTSAAFKTSLAAALTQAKV